MMAAISIMKSNGSMAQGYAEEMWLYRRRNGESER